MHRGASRSQLCQALSQRDCQGQLFLAEGSGPLFIGQALECTCGVPGCELISYLHQDGARLSLFRQ